MPVPSRAPTARAATALATTALGRRLAPAALALAMTTAAAGATEIAIQSRYPALQLPGAPEGGGHPIGGPTKAFVDYANTMLAPLGVTFTLHASGNVPPSDDLQPAIVDRRTWGTLHAAVAAGPEAGGLAAAAGIPVNSGLAFGEPYSGGLPLGLTGHEFIGFLLKGGGLDLQQTFYDEAFDGNVVVLPIAVMPPQTSGMFPEPLPSEQSEGAAQAAMAAFCRMPVLVRYPSASAEVIRRACEEVGVGIDTLGRQTRCADPRADCGTEENPVVNEVTRLTVGGFAPGLAPHIMAENGNIDAYELNLPSHDLQFLKLAAGQREANNDADLSAVAQPYGYVTGWHQPLTYVELLINRGVWDGLPEGKRNAVTLAAQAATLMSYADAIATQGEAMRRLEANGVTFLAFPPELLERFADHRDAALDQLAADAAADGDDTFERLLTALRAFKTSEARYLFNSEPPQPGTLPTRP